MARTRAYDRCEHAICTFADNKSERIPETRVEWYEEVFCVHRYPSFRNYKSLDLINDTIYAIHLAKYVSVKQPSHHISYLSEIPLKSLTQKIKYMKQKKNIIIIIVT